MSSKDLEITVETDFTPYNEAVRPLLGAPPEVLARFIAAIRAGMKPYSVRELEPSGNVIRQLVTPSDFVVGFMAAFRVSAAFEKDPDEPWPPPMNGRYYTPEEKDANPALKAYCAALRQAELDRAWEPLVVVGVIPKSLRIDSSGK